LSAIPFDVLAIPAVILVSITAAGILLTQSATWLVLLLAMQNVGVFLLVAEQWPAPMALSILIAGWISAVVIGWVAFSPHQTEAVSDREEGQIQAHPGVSLFYGKMISALLFRLLAAILVVITMISASPTIIRYVPDTAMSTALGGMVLIGLGLLQLGLSDQPIRVVVGLLTVLAGFEILYSVVEISALVVGLLNLVTMSLAVLGAYFILLPGMDET
jgi:hypothetical protein